MGDCATFDISKVHLLDPNTTGRAESLLVATSKVHSTFAPPRWDWEMGLGSDL
ncbi:unnamed protein product [Acidithrix sp. C25]|nr:unnamed protein product [Acidithrix sp. C25]